MALMGVQIKLDDRPEWAAKKLGVQEDSTPLDPSDMTGGVGQMTFEIPNRPENRSIRHALVKVDHTERGLTEGIVDAYGGNRSDITVTAFSRLVLLNVEQRIPPYSGTLGGLMTLYFESCGITSGFTIDSSIASKTAIVPGGKMNVWEAVKRACSAFQVEVSLVAGVIKVRPPRKIIASSHRDASFDWSIDDGELAKTVEIAYYQSKWVTNALVYPAGGWNDDVDVLTVDAGETAEFEFELDASLVDVQQPVCVDDVDRYYDDSSVYAVAGNDDKMIVPEYWEDNGGRLTVEIDETTRKLKITLVGMSVEKYSPYRIAMPAGGSSAYSSLRLLGTGITYKREILTLDASPDDEHATEQVGVTVDNECIRTKDQAFIVGLPTAMRYSGCQRKITVSTRGINKFEDYFANQAYGNLAGARVFADGTWHRIRNNTADDLHSYTAEVDTTIDDLNAAWVGSGLTYDDWRNFWGDATFDDMRLRPVDAPVQPITNVYPDAWYPDEVYPAE
ncbi:hypothetical protein [Agromyces sp. NPDC058104]|uniref:hypothetical protein n=1 Tax=Agromyces sp. NPDC058104 TaxID=3346342 RepID=UPI0036DB0625